MTENVSRAAEVQSGVRLEVFTVLWMVLEAGVSIGAGVMARSALLTAFGLDSLIELVSGAILLWRLRLEASQGETEQVERAERRAAWVVAVCLALLCVYVLLTAAYGLLAHAEPEASPVGVSIALAAVVVMAWLGLTKRRMAERINSAALRGDAGSAFTCGYMAAAVLVGLALNALFQWWWAEDLAALVFLFWLVRETREAVEAARGGEEE